MPLTVVNSPQPEPATATPPAHSPAHSPEGSEAEVGSVFVSNYPPFSFWKSDRLPEVEAALHSPPRPETPLGLYLHIPFCRKRCKFCYFRVYTDKNASEIERLPRRARHARSSWSAGCRRSGRRPFRFVYFGGGTPSFLSVRQLSSLVDRLQANMPWDEAEEVTFECEPGTLTQPKVEAIRAIGVTRLTPRRRELRRRRPA